MAIGRVTQRMLTESANTSVQSGLARMARVQEHLATGKVLNRPSDNPTDTTSAMRLRAGIADHEQYARNAQDGIGWLTQVDATLDTVTTAVRRARELALQGNNTGAMGPLAREALAVEVDGIREELLAQANSKYLDRPIFGGVTAGGQAYDGSGTYVGVPGDVNRRVADGVHIKVDVDGPDVFGDGAQSVFGELADLAARLRAGGAGLSTSIDDLKARLDTVTSVRTAAGSRLERIESAVETAESSKITLDNNLSLLENTDLAAATVDLQLAEVAYQASLAATARVLQPSLVDFLR